MGNGGPCYHAFASCFGGCPDLPGSEAPWAAPAYTQDIAGFGAYCASWSANAGVFNGDAGFCPGKVPSPPPSSPSPPPPSPPPSPAAPPALPSCLVEVEASAISPSNGLTLNTAGPSSYHEGSGLSTGGTATFSSPVHLTSFEAIGAYSSSYAVTGCNTITFQALNEAGAEVWTWTGDLTESGAGISWSNWKLLNVDVSGVKSVKILDKRMDTSPYCWPSFGRFTESAACPN